MKIVYNTRVPILMVLMYSFLFSHTKSSSLLVLEFPSAFFVIKTLYLLRALKVPITLSNTN